LKKSRKCIYIIWGQEYGYSVLDIINTFEKVNNLKINYKFAERRSGDIATCYASSEKAKREMGWFPKKTIEDMCRDSWNYQKLTQM